MGIDDDGAAVKPSRACREIVSGDRQRQRQAEEGAGDEGRLEHGAS
jgi:hypothetical protein